MTYVWPLYSNIGSQPVKNKVTRRTYKSHTESLTKIRWTSCWYYLTLLLIRPKKGRRRVADTNICAALKDNRFMARAFTIGKRAYCLGRFIRVSSKEVIDSFMPKLFQEPLAVRKNQ